MKRYRKILISALVGCTLFVTLAFTGTNYFEITKNLDIFTTLYKELNTYYVDTLNPEQLMRAGIGEMLGGLEVKAQAMRADRADADRADAYRDIPPRSDGAQPYTTP